MDQQDMQGAYWHSGKHPKQMDSDASKLITVPITPSNGTVVQNGSISLINSQSVCTKSFENYPLTFISGGISVRIAIIYRLHTTEKYGLKL